jgi:2,3-bisphosphoglycerate-dependent phosphoglycerate mutase
MISRVYGYEQFMKWRRGYDTRPPAISSFSQHYPGNDERYVKYVKDIPISWFETFIRSLANGRAEIHREFPKTESLKDCMERTIPYFKEVIVPQSLNEGKSVLVSSSENAIRGLLMHLCDIPTDQIHQVEIPTGLPMVFDWRVNRVRLLHDDEVQNPFMKYNFGTKPELLFKPESMSIEEFSAVIENLHTGSCAHGCSEDTSSRSSDSGSGSGSTAGGSGTPTEQTLYHPIIPQRTRS